VRLPNMSGMRLRAAILMACALVPAACGSSSQTSSSSSTQAANQATTTSPATTTAPPTASSGPSTTTTTSTPTTTVPGSRACRAADLTASFLGGQGATGHGELGFALRNTSGSACHTFGYPGVLFLGRAGQALPTDSTRTTHDFFGSAPEQELAVAPGETVSFRLGVTHGAASPQGCTTAYGLQVIPPDDTATLRVTIGNGGAYECRTATVSPLQRGDSAFP
jgi:uncharacterized protein DUF4232